MAETTRRRMAMHGVRRMTGLTMIAGLVAALVMGWSAMSRAEPEADSVTGTYSPEELVYDNPISAIHEMGAGPAIPFLPEDQPQPRIVVPDEVYDFGLLGPKDVVTHTFVIRNDGKAPLTISRAYTTCGCTTAEITARVIPPGKVALATIRFDAGFHDARGKIVQRGLIIESNDPNRWKAAIWTRAAIRWN